MAKIPFTVSARTARLIGQENFANSEGAVIELVKNCYDADAKNGIIYFDNTDPNPQNHSIFIIDNGTGMTDDIIKKHWMMIGTDNKEDDVETESGRVKTGAKGIGRFALDKLGVISEMYTIPKETNKGFYWKVDWNEFQQKGISISQVSADLEDLENFDLKSKIVEFSDNFSPLLKLTYDIEFQHGTIIKISNLRENWSSDEIKHLFGNLEILIPPKEQPTFKVFLFSKSEPSEYGELTSAYYDDFDYRVSAKYLADVNRTVVITVERNELDVKTFEKDYKEIFSSPLMKDFPFNFDTFKKGKFDYNVNLNELVKGYSEIDSNNLLDKIGKFNFTFYYMKNSKSDDGDAKKYPYKNFNGSTRKAWLKKFGGVKIFRDDFRVRPYGEYGQDWLSLGERQAQSPGGAGQKLGGYRIRPNQISGTINISRVTNISFQDKSGREGIQENEVFSLFKEIIKNLIGQFERDRNIVMYSFSELHKKRNKEAEDKRKAEELARQILEQQQNLNNNNESSNSPTNENNSINNSTNTPVHTGPTQAEIDLAKGVQAQQEEIREKDDEIRLLRSLAGTGLIVSSFAHELRSLRSLLVSRTEDLKTVLQKLLMDKDIKNLPVEENPYSMLNEMREQDVHIKHWLDYSLSALKRDRRTRTNLDITNYFQGFKGNWDNALNRRKVSLAINNKLKESISIRAFAIDFDTVFNNLLANSLDSFKRRKDNNARSILVEISESKETLSIIFSDTGAGLSKDFKNPDDIFLPFETSKVDRKGNKIGTGMGMYLIKSIIDDYNGNIEILEKENGFSVEILFPLRKTN